MVFIDKVSLAIEFYGASLALHVDLKFFGSTASFGTVEAVAQGVPALADGESDTTARGELDEEQAEERASEFGECVKPLLTEEHGQRQERVDGGEVAGLDGDEEEEAELEIAVKKADGDKQAEDSAETACQCNTAWYAGKMQQERGGSGAENGTCV